MWKAVKQTARPTQESDYLNKRVENDGVVSEK